MPKYAWEVKNRSGRVLKGVMRAGSREAVEATLREKGFAPGRIREKGKGLDMEISIPGLGGGVKGKDIAVFTRQFSTMIAAGLPLVQCLDILSQESANPALKEALFEIKDEVESGSTFADALGRHPRIFDDLYVNLVAAGEVGGILDNILERLASYIEKAEKLKGRIKGAMIYPIIVMTVAVAIVAILMVAVIPVFADLFKGMGRELPAFTQMVIDTSEWFRSQLLFLVCGAALFAVVYKVIGRNPAGRLMLDAAYLKVPLIGDLLRKSSVARFTRTLGTMVSSGVPILDALDITSKTAGNKIVEKEIMGARKAVSEGKTLVEPLKGSEVFGPMVVQMISVGEQTGALDNMLHRIADFYEDEVDAAVDALTAAMEPLMIVILGIVVGGLAVAMYLPIFYGPTAF